MSNPLKTAEDFAVAGKSVEAAAIYEELLGEAAPALTDLCHNLAAVSVKARLSSRALEAAQAACFFGPEKARNWLSLNHIQNRLGLGDAALASLYRALELEPDNLSIQETRLFALAQRLDPLSYREEAERWFSSLPVVSCTKRVRSTPSLPRIGYVTGDLRLHVMDRFIEALMQHHDRERFEIVFFDNTPEETRKGPVRERLLSYGYRIADIAGLNDDTAAEAASQCDILVDLGGLGAHHRLGIFRRRPCPVQLTGIGFLPTTGGDCFNYRLSDYELPEQYTEPLWSLPCAAVPLPLCPEIPVASLPATRNGFITFGYVNGLHKLSPQSVADFISVLQAVEGSRLLLMVPGASDPETAKFVLRRFDPVQHRVVLTESQGGEAFVKLFSEIDIALDPSPCGGMTTTKDTLFHGVPIVTRAADRRIGEDAWRLQWAFGLTHVLEGYVDQALELAADLDRLAVIRSRLRPAYLQHPVGQPCEWVRSLEDSYIRMLAATRLRAAA